MPSPRKSSLTIIVAFDKCAPAFSTHIYLIHFGWIYLNLAMASTWCMVSLEIKHHSSFLFLVLVFENAFVRSALASTYSSILFLVLFSKMSSSTQLMPFYQLGTSTWQQLDAAAISSTLISYGHNFLRRFLCMVSSDYPFSRSSQ